MKSIQILVKAVKKVGLVKALINLPLPRGEDCAGAVGEKKYDNYVGLQYLQDPAPAHYTVKYVP